MSGSAGDSIPVQPQRAPDCLRCQFFAVSWDPDFPRSCTVFGIKSRQLPSILVYEATGRHCPAYRLSPRIKRGPSRGP